MPDQEATAPGSTEPSTVRDKLWLWGHDAGAHNEGWGLPRPSRITPAEAAIYLGIPNLFMVRYLSRPPLPLDQYTLPHPPSSWARSYRASDTRQQQSDTFSDTPTASRLASFAEVCKKQRVEERRSGSVWESNLPQIPWGIAHFPPKAAQNPAH